MKALWIQSRVLTWKTFLSFYRSKLSTFLQLLCPLFICVYLTCIQLVVDGATDKLVDPEPSVSSLSSLNCYGDGCVSLRICLTGPPVPWTDFVIDHLASENDLEIGKDIIVHQQQAQEFIDYFKDHKNTTQIAVIFCSSELVIPNNVISTFPCDPGYIYSLMYNTTEAPLTSPAHEYINQDVLTAKIMIDNAILAYEASIAEVEAPVIQAEVQPFPNPKFRQATNINVVSTQGGIYFFIPSVFLFGMFLIEIAKEKEGKLRQGLIVMGLSNFAYWVSWFLVSAIVALVSANLHIIGGYIFGFEVFTNAPYLVWLMVFYSYAQTMIIFGFFMSALISKTKMAYTMSYVFVLGGLVFQFFFSSSTLTLILHMEGLPTWVYWVKAIFGMYPPFTFAKMFNDVSVKAGVVFDPEEEIWVSGPGYTWEDFVSRREGTVGIYHYSIPALSESILKFVAVSAFYTVLLWYLDHVISSNRGKNYPLTFFCSKQYWSCKKRQRVDSIEMQLMGEQALPYEKGLVLDKIEKIYNAGGVSLQAVYPLEFSLENNQLLALIGHNGAGKTTLLSMLTGLLNPTSGTAYMCGYDIQTQTEEISRVIGFCPQHDILWEELTATEHIYLFSRIKLLDKSPSHILDMVSLQKDADKPVRTFSGGMKRRLSVGISTIGNPNIVFLDEPTTGMDPISRKLVWNLIKEIKRNRIVVLTTHAMEEADILADKIAVMVDGRIACSGTSLALKNKFGEGYKVDIIANNASQLWNLIERRFVGVSMIDISGCSLVVSVAIDKPLVLKALLVAIEEGELGGLIEDWALCNSSLEEVFMKITGKKQH